MGQDSIIIIIDIDPEPVPCNDQVWVWKLRMIVTLKMGGWKSDGDAFNDFFITCWVLLPSLTCCLFISEGNENIDNVVACSDANDSNSAVFSIAHVSQKLD